MTGLKSFLRHNLPVENVLAFHLTLMFSERHLKHTDYRKEHVMLLFFLLLMLCNLFSGSPAAIYFNDGK